MYGAFEKPMNLGIPDPRSPVLLEGLVIAIAIVFLPGQVSRATEVFLEFLYLPYIAASYTHINIHAGLCVDLFFAILGPRCAPAPARWRYLDGR